MFSCKKEKDSFSYKVEFIDPHPEKSAYDVALRGSSIGFDEIKLEGIAEYTKEYTVYFDTENLLKINTEQENHIQEVRHYHF